MAHKLQIISTNLYPSSIFHSVRHEYIANWWKNGYIGTLECPNQGWARFGNIFAKYICEKYLRNYICEIEKGTLFIGHQDLKWPDLKCENYTFILMVNTVSLVKLISINFCLVNWSPLLILSYLYPTNKKEYYH